ncbi:uncharacterized protein BDZ99DRAFT_43298 [Mytilinidion resinicola]|uniref:Uncharacterized protein n=1 Tax=Mytilinidion resinicola TaxID=574789 RepID=A0A6A6YLX0_9PEZI|nr:uncharacterized protein BDZ99DRAFT_43298 [Mytilinidion resinicola]KAF2808975.1 hypothetical protein BDZ99DRAFT_43298 [Mytilinidion resinicola]
MEELVKTVVELIDLAHLRYKQGAEIAAEALRKMQNGKPDGTLFPFHMWLALNTYYSQAELRKLHAMGPTSGCRENVQEQDMNNIIDEANKERQYAHNFSENALRVLQNGLPDGRRYPLNLWTSLRGLVSEESLYELSEKGPTPHYWRSDSMPKPDPRKARRAHDPNWKNVPAESPRKCWVSSCISHPHIDTNNLFLVFDRAAFSLECSTANYCEDVTASSSVVLSWHAGHEKGGTLILEQAVLCVHLSATV